MRQINDIARERDTMSTVVELTSAFEGIASMHISQIKDQVLTSQNFFDELWRIYSQIRVDETFHFGRGQAKTIAKELIILVTAEGSFSGDVDQRVVEAVRSVYDEKKNDIVVVGHHGAVQLRQRGVPIVHSFKLPHTDTNINVLPLAAEVQKYASTVVYYPTYSSLMRQDVKHIQMSAEVAERGRSVTEKDEEIITEGDYIFEPSAFAVVSHLENSMLQIMLSQIILESKLAQYASRFRAMHAARDKADDSFSELSTAFNQAKRHNKDERIKEIINGLNSLGKASL